MSAAGGLTLEHLRASVADVLGVDGATLRDDEPLPDQGLDSIRLMAVVERLRARGVDVTFSDLAERPTLGDWTKWLAADG